MDKALGIILALCFACIPARAQILAPILYGSAPAAANSVVVRCTTSGSTTLTSVTVTLPSCKTAGDLIVVFLGTQNLVSSIPSNWAAIDASGYAGTSNWGGVVSSHLLTSAEVSTGTVPFVISATGQTVYFAVEFVGATGGTSDLEKNVVSNYTTTLATITTSSVAYSAGDMVITAATARNNGPVTITEGTQAEQQTNSAGSGAMNYISESSSGSSATQTGNYATYNTQGAYQATIVVRGGSFSPESIPGLELAFDAACITRSGLTCATPSNGSTLSTWVNIAGASGAAQTANGTCTFQTAQLNGQPSVTFNGSSCYVSGLPTLAYLPSGYSGAVVMENTSSAAKGTMFGSNSSSGTGGGAYWTCASSKEQGNDAQNVSQTGSGTAACDTTWHQMNFAYTNNSGFPSYRIGEAADTTVNGSTSSWVATKGPVTLGRNNVGASEYLNGKLAVAYWYSRALTSGEITSLEAFLNARFGI